MSQTSSKSGGCHCGAVRYEIQMADSGGPNNGLGDVLECNCTICEKRGLLLVFVPEKNFNLTTKAGLAADYQFGEKRIHHLFCPICGVESYATGKAPDGSQMMAVNVRCLDGVDVAALTTKPHDGRSA